ncbi:MAG: response regulator [Candidatus Thiodiazotropha taylori]|nr:response regulator [Candidatus Thiodiazotropha taylori]
MVSQSRIILLIEDDGDHAELAEFYIKEYDANIDVVRISDGAEALQYIGQIRKKILPAPWIVLLDLKLPKYDGHEILTEFKSDNFLKRIPVIIFSTSNSIKDITKAVTSGCNSYIVKPMEPDSYGLIFPKIISYWELCQHHLLADS